MGIFSWFGVGRKEGQFDQDSLSHEVRNAVLGIQLERRNLWKAVDLSDRRVQAHLKRIEEALVQCRKGTGNES